MAATQLSEVFVQISAKGLAETMNQLKQVKEELAKTKKPASELESAMGRLGQNALRNAGPLGQLGSAFQGISAGGAGAAAGVGAVIAVVAGAAMKMVSVIGQAKETIVGLARAGFEGTVQMNRYQFAMQLLGREVAGAMVPVLNLLTSIIKQVTSTLSSFGGTGQKVMAAVVVGMTILTGVITLLSIAAAALIVTAAPIVVFFFVVAGALTAVIGAIYLAWTYSAGFRSAVLQLKMAFADLFTALEPIGVVLLKLAMVIGNTFIVKPLINFITALTVIVQLLERAVKSFTRLMGISGLKIPTGDKTSVTLNNTGEESAAGTFQRIQQSILNYEPDKKSEDEKQTDYLANIEKLLRDKFKIPNLEIPSAADIVRGGTEPLRQGFDSVARSLGMR